MLLWRWSCDFSGEGLLRRAGTRYGYHENEAYNYLQCDLFPVAQCGDSVRCHRPVGKSGNALAVASISVIGALHYETQVAQAAAEQVGMDTLSAAEMTPQAFSTIALLMSICIIWGMTLSIFLNKKYTQKLTSNKKSGKPGFGDMAMTAMFIGLVSTYIGRYLGGFVSENGLFTFHEITFR